MAKFIELMAPFVPAIQSILWISLIAVCVTLFYKQARKIFEAIVQRIEKGSSFKAGPVELGSDLENLNSVTPVSDENIVLQPRKALPEKSDALSKNQNDWANERTEIYQKNKGIFLAHVISPCSNSQKNLKYNRKYYDVFVYLVRHQTTDFCDVDKAEFFFGHMWRNEVFEEKERNGIVGVHTSAYGPFLCTCRVYFKDGTHIFINRYIDFEMSRTFK